MAGEVVGEEIVEGKLIGAKIAREGKNKYGKDYTIHALEIKLADGNKIEFSAFSSQKDFLEKYVKVTLEKVETVKDGKTYTNLRMKSETKDNPTMIEIEAPKEQPKAEKIYGKPQADKAEPKTDWNLKNQRDSRGMILSYAKDLVCNGKLELNEMIPTAGRMFEFVWSGNVDDAKKKETKPKQDSPEDVLVEEIVE